jgi:hypothetical protein
MRVLKQAMCQLGWHNLAARRWAAAWPAPAVCDRLVAEDMFAKGSLLACAFVGFCTAVSGDPVDAATGRDRSTLGHAVKPEVIALDSIAPRERSPNGSDRQQPPHRKASKTPIVRQGAIEATGGIPVEVIRRILRQNHGRYRQCYEKGLARHPNLRGEARVRFAIELDGSASNSRDDGSTLPDASVIRCIGDALERLSFPKPQGPWAGPDGGPMSVLVHFWLSPG